MIGLESRAMRPGFMTDIAEAAKWKGGNFNGAREAAQRRAIQNSWAFTAMNEKAMEYAKGRLRIYAVDGSEDGMEIQNHHFLRVLRNPNPLMGQAALMQFSSWWSDLDGNYFWMMLPDETGFRLAEIWPLPSYQVRVVPGNKDRMVDYYEYQVNGRLVPIPAEYIFQHKLPNPFDIFRGLSPLVAAMLPIDSDSAMAHWNGAFFGQDNVMPSAIISLSSGNPTSPIDPRDIDEIKDDLANNYTAGRRKTIVTNAYQMAAQLLGYNAKDMDFLGGRELTQDEIYQVLGFPPGYASKNSTESNSTVGYAKFMEFISGLHRLSAEQMTSLILPRWYPSNVDLVARFDDVRPINKDMVLREAEASKNDMTQNERRERFWKLPAIDGGDVLPSVQMQASGGPTPFGIDDGFSRDVLAKPTNALMPSARKTVDAESLQDDLKKWRAKAIKSIKIGEPAAVSFVSKAIPEALGNAVIAGLDFSEHRADIYEVFELAQKGIIRSWRPWSMFEEKLADEIEETLRAQAEKLVAKLRENGNPTDLEDPTLWREHEEEIRAVMEPILIELSLSAVKRVKDTLGTAEVSINWNLANDNATAWARQHAGELVKQVNRTTRSQIADQVANWTQSSEGLDGLISRIENLKDVNGEVFGRDRAETIAITEATNTYGQANADAWEAAGYPKVVYRPGAHVKCRCYSQPWKFDDGSKGVVWYTARDERVCTRPIETPWGVVKGCAALHGVVISEGPYLGQKVR
jgi:phage portal protein BeeE